MPAPKLTLCEAAIHELGHAMVACALQMPVKKVVLRIAEAPMQGWGGQCLLEEPNLPYRRVSIDAFQLGGPLAQIIIEPSSLAGLGNLFHPSVFTNAPDLMNHKFDTASKILGWGSDLFKTGMMQSAPTFPLRHLHIHGYGGDRPWILGLETEIRSLFFLPEVQGTVRFLRPWLVQHLVMPGDTIKAVFDSRITTHQLNAIRTFVAAQPN